MIVHASVIDRLAERLGHAVRDIQVGKAWDLSTYVNTVVTKEDRDRLIGQIEDAKKEAESTGGKVIANRSKKELPGFCVGHAVFN